jgi:hypothetical protein
MSKRNAATSVKADGTSAVMDRLKALYFDKIKVRQRRKRAQIAAGRRQLSPHGRLPCRARRVARLPLTRPPPPRRRRPPPAAAGGGVQLRRVLLAVLEVQRL